jgi:hypothetical protein
VFRAEKGIQRKQARNIDAQRETTRIGAKKAQAVDIPVELLYKLKHPTTGFWPNVTRS